MGALADAPAPMAVEPERDPARAYEPYRALYLHIPFCVRRCAYCDFATSAEPGGSPRMRSYVESMVLAVRRAAKAGLTGSVETIYLGGGTPTHLGQSLLTELLYAIGLSLHVVEGVEFSMEANPESVTERLVRDAWALGVNRISLGVQSFDDAVLRTLGRAHDSQGALRAIEAIRTRFENLSIDLICGIPGQTRESFAADLRRVRELGIPHVSVYPLTIEEGTPFERMVEKGELAEPDPDLQADLMLMARSELIGAGFEPYEVASLAKPGHACRHNIAYWTGVPYLGIGAGAVGMRQGPWGRERYEGARVTDALSAREALAEDLMLACRMRAGIPAALAERAALELAGFERCVDELSGLGLLAREGGSLVPTERGWLLGNELFGRLLELGEGE